MGGSPEVVSDDKPRLDNRYALKSLVILPYRTVTNLRRAGGTGRDTHLA